MNPAEQVLRRVDRYQQQHPWVGVPFAVVKKFGDDKGGNLTTLLTYNGFFALLPLLLVLVTLLGYLLGHHAALACPVPELWRRISACCATAWPSQGPH
jgi:uncharacterized BrkB/YihY/UPF0761 family membrane protein